jgi:hypothetical protein
MPVVEMPNETVKVDNKQSGFSFITKKESGVSTFNSSNGSSCLIDLNSHESKQSVKLQELTNNILNIYNGKEVTNTALTTTTSTPQNVNQGYKNLFSNPNPQQNVNYINYNQPNINIQNTYYQNPNGFQQQSYQQQGLQQQGYPNYNQQQQYMQQQPNSYRGNNNFMNSNDLYQKSNNGGLNNGFNNNFTPYQQPQQQTFGNQFDLSGNNNNGTSKAPQKTDPFKNLISFN